MQLRRLTARFELPLLKRELVELAQRRRTYVLRVLLMLILSLVFVTFYVEMSSRRTTVLRMLGTGRELSMALIITDLFAIYALLPAMACSAISSEREKQTLPLLLISRLRPGIIILEKFISRLIPMLGLLVITTPLLAMTYVLGGVTQTDLSLLVLVLLTAAIQASSCAVFCSSLFSTGLNAFWATYLLLAALALGPPLLHMMELTPDMQWVSSLPGEQQVVPFTMFFLLIDRMWSSQLSFLDVCLACLPVWMLSAVLLIAARFSLLWIGAGTGLTNKWGLRFLRMVRNAAPRILTLIRTSPRRIVAWLSSIRPNATGPWESGQETGSVSDAASLPDSQPIAWRETRGALLANWFVQLCFFFAFGFVQIVLLETEFTSRWDREGLCLMVDVAIIIIGLLLMVGQSCRMFATERERQTMDVLLTIPMTNIELLRQKQRSVTKLLFLLLVPLTGALLIHLGYVPLRAREYTPTYSNYELVRYSSGWWSAATLLAFVVWTHGIVYLSIARWTGILFGLLFRSQMKAMVGTIISLLVLSFVPALLCALVMLSMGSDPDDFPLFCFSSPAIIYGFALAGELATVYGRSWFPGSAWVVVVFNLLVYGGLVLLLRTLVIRWFPKLLNRLDADTDIGQLRVRAHSQDTQRDTMTSLAGMAAERRR